MLKSCRSAHNVLNITLQVRKKTMNRLSLIALPLFALAAAANAHAAEDTSDFQVRIQILESCDISSVAPTDIDFQTHARGAGAPATAQGTLTVNCSAGTPYQIGLNSGTNGGGAATSGTRHLSDGVTLIPYDLYQDASHTKFWGNTQGNDMLGAIGTASNQSHTVYGRVPSTNFPAGTYTDTVTARVVY